ncbi:Ruby [Aphelenchoides besseyi]|nr:Ruby [Aphelenchoides besseyi]KAI6207869.1 Ruby [Aphelenchoides besseyi]
MRAMAYAEGLTSPEIEIAEGGTMLDNKSKFADLKTMLDNNKENVKMEAMKRIINMVARGKDVSDLFPAVVKNVAVKNLELKKLVYVYLVRYAEEQQDLALLSISTFQRALKDPNQLIRASALRVLSSIRVQMIAPVMLLAIKESVRDMSAYVRKVAAHAIPKLFALDPDLQPQLIECIDFLLGDKRTLVLGSAVHAFEQTCPDRLDLLHRHFRALCRALVDVDEWGQIVLIGLLTRYARTQFTFPNQQNHDEPLDPDHSLLIISAKSLLQSRNCAVILELAKLLYYVAPPSHYSVVPRALVRLLRGPNEVQYVVLVNIATICNAQNNLVKDDVFAISKNLFEPFLKSFFVRSNDTSHIKRLKLQILTSLVTETNVQLVVRELQAYLQMNDLAGEAIEAIGRCALQVESSSDACLSCLINLISSSREHVVCSAVVVLKRLLHTDAPVPLLKRVVRLMDSIKAAAARACVIWLICTHIEKVSNLAPDLLRVLAKNFADESDVVKLQTLNLAVRLWACDRERCELLVRYVLQLARYDRDYDIRDRCRLLRNCLFRSSDSAFPVDCFLGSKPAPSMHSQFSDRDHFQLGTLSHLLNQKCSGYTELPDFPETAPEEGRSARSVLPLGVEEIRTKQNNDLSEQEESDESEIDEEEEVEDEIEEEELEDEESESESEEVEDESQEDSSIADSISESEEKATKLVNGNAKKNHSPQQTPPVQRQKPQKPSAKQATRKQTDHDLLLDLDFDSVSSGVNSRFSRTSALHVPSEFVTILSPVSANGLKIERRFTRAPSVFSNSMLSVELAFSFDTQSLATADVVIRLDRNQSSDITSSGDVLIAQLKRSERQVRTVGIDFGDSGRRSVWRVEFDGRQYSAEIAAPFLEQVEAIDLSAEELETERKRLGGMHAVTKQLPKLNNFNPSQLYRITNCKQVRGLQFTFAAQTVSRKHALLIAIVSAEDVGTQLTVNCENVAFGALFAEALQSELTNLAVN